ncbi:MAG TPA: thiamine phosphate synthase [Polyangia bacterium]|jgi:thiamine-phosphate pyrophosphorylase|nr:thiamine phosphate synthase [Polyangia bacterium]
MSAPDARLRGLYGMVDLPARRPGEPGGRGRTAPPAGRLARALIAGGARVLQLRMKGADAAAVLAVVDELRPLCRQKDLLFIVNDRLDVALAGGADGVHLGQDDLPLAEARRLAPAGFRIGISTHNLAQARAAAAGGADYIGFGPVFPTASKQDPDPVVGVAQLAEVCRTVSVPVVAIGGITRATVRDVVRAGAAAAALIGDVNHPAVEDPGAWMDAVTAAAREVSSAW